MAEKSEKGSISNLSTKEAAADSVDAARAVLCDAVEMKLLRRIRSDLGLVYGISCGYSDDSGIERPIYRDPSVSVSFSSAPDDARKCIDSVREVLATVAAEGPEEKDF